MQRSTSKMWIVDEFAHNRAASEAYQVLRTNIEFANVNDRARTIMIASTVKGEGKSVISANLARTYSSGKKTLLIDANMRNPSQHRLFNIPNATGLSTLLSNQSDLEESIVSVGNSNFCLLPSGPLLANPPEALGSERMFALLSKLKVEYEVIIIDTPAVLAVADAQIIASQCDGVLLVVKSGKVNRDALEKAKAVLDLAEVKMLGAVLNDMRSKNTQYYSPY